MIDFILTHKFEIALGILVILILFRKKIKKFILKKQKKRFSYTKMPDMMDDGKSFEAEFNFNKISAEEGDRYEKKLKEIDAELKKIGREEIDIEEEFKKKKFMLIHKRKQLSIQYNMYLNNLKNVNLLLDNQKKLDEGVKEEL